MKAPKLISAILVVMIALLASSCASTPIPPITGGCGTEVPNGDSCASTPIPPITGGCGTEAPNGDSGYTDTIAVSPPKFEVGYKPPLIPIRISIDNCGKVSVVASETATIRTPIGDFDIGGSISFESAQEKYKQRVLIIRVDSKVTVYELEDGKAFEVKLDSSGQLYKTARFAQNPDGDIILELESIRSNVPSSQVSVGGNPGQAHPDYPNVIAGKTKDTWYPAPGYTWAEPNNQNNFQVVWLPGTGHSQYPHVIASKTEGQWLPAPGYRWVKPDGAGDLRVVWIPGVEHPDHPNVVAAAAEGQWLPAPGYRWAKPNTFGDVVWTPGVEHPDHPNVVAAAAEGQWHPAPGYRWAKPNTFGDVVWTPGVEHPDHPHVIAGKDGKWYPAPGYIWVDPNSNDLRVKPK